MTRFLLPTSLIGRSALSGVENYVPRVSVSISLSWDNKKQVTALMQEITWANEEAPSTLQHLWLFDNEAEASIVTDEIGSAHITTNATRSSSYIEIDGVGKTFATDAGDVQSAFSGDWTLAYWVEFTSLDATNKYHMTLGNGNWGGIGDACFYSNNYSNSIMLVSISNGSSVSNIYTNGPTIPLNTPIFVSYRYTRVGGVSNNITHTDRDWETSIIELL